MSRPPALRRASAPVLAKWLAVIVAGLLAALGALAPLAAALPAPRTDTDPLVVHLDKITPVARQDGKVRISGTVTNTTTEPYTRVNLHAFSSQSPILDAPLLAAAAETDPADYVGERVTTPGTFATVDVLDPGQTAPFSLAVPVELLGIDAAPGDYWIGVHALGDSSVPRDGFADGKARTFIPFLPRFRPRAQDPVPVSIVLPLRGPVWYSADGSLARTDRWMRELSEGGKYVKMLDAAVAAGDRPYTILVDPALLTAVSHLTVGNPPRSLLPDPTVPGQEPPTVPEDEGGEGATAPLATLTPTPANEQSDEQQALAALASEWMAKFIETATGKDVLALPYGDLDVSAASRFSFDRYTEATARSRQVMGSLGLDFHPAIVPPSSFIRPEALAALAPTDTVLLGDTAFAVPPETPTSMVKVLGHRVVVTSSGAAAGGPGPTEATDPLAMRQRLLSEAALRLGGAGLDDSGRGGSGQPVVLTLPATWGPDETQLLLGALDQPWIEPVTVSELTRGKAFGVSAQSLVYTDQDEAEELDQANFAQADDLTTTAGVFEQVLTLQTTLERQVRDEALSTLSTQHRLRSEQARLSAQRLELDLRTQLGSIRVVPPKAVTLSSDSGPFGTTLVNGLDQPVTVALEASTDGEISLAGTGVRELAPNSRALARLEATAARPGIHTVQLLVTSKNGTPLGSTAELPIRAAQVSGLIWLAMAAGAALLFGAIAVRLVRRVRRRSAEEPSADGQQDE